MKNLMKKKLSKKGFTLVELIVVIAIVAVLAVIGIPVIAGQVSKSQMSTAVSNAKTIAYQAQTMITQYEAAGSTVPSDTTLKSDACLAAGLKIGDCSTFSTTDYTVDFGPDGSSGGGDDVTGRKVIAVDFKVGKQTGIYSRA